jgi:ribosomal protein L22
MSDERDNNLDESEGVEPLPIEELDEEAAVQEIPDEELTTDDVPVELDETEAVASDEPEALADAPVAEEPAAKKAPAKKPAAKKPAAKKPAAKKAPAPKPQDAEPARVVRAHAKYVRTSARKARLVCDQIRGKDVGEAYAILAHTPRAVAEDWEKLLKSAVANAENNHEMVGDDLKIVAAFADEGPTLKRFRPRAMGRATKIRKRTSHLTIQLTVKD